MCRFNSGAITKKGHPARGHMPWLPLADYPHREYRRRYRVDSVLVEVTVLGGVPDVVELLADVQHA